MPLVRDCWNRGNGNKILFTSIFSFLLSPCRTWNLERRRKGLLYLCLSLSLLNKSKACFKGIEGTPGDHVRTRSPPVRSGLGWVGARGDGGSDRESRFFLDEFVLFIYVTDCVSTFLISV